MDESPQSVALKLETVFRVGDSFKSADQWRNDFRSCLEDGLLVLCALGLLPKNEISMWLEEYSFEKNSLDEILQEKSNKERIEELYCRVRCLRK